jgi:hypothetical protein
MGTTTTVPMTATKTVIGVSSDLTYASDVCHSVARRLSRMLLILLDSAMIDDDFDHDVYHDDDEAV